MFQLIANPVLLFKTLRQGYTRQGYTSLSFGRIFGVGVGGVSQKFNGFAYLLHNIFRSYAGMLFFFVSELWQCHVLSDLCSRPALMTALFPCFRQSFDFVRGLLQQGVVVVCDLPHWMAPSWGTSCLEAVDLLLRSDMKLERDLKVPLLLLSSMHGRP